MFTDTIEIDGREFNVSVEQDDIGEPWKWECGHGPVSDWTTRDKAPGEIVLSEDRGFKRYYDFAEACTIARRDNWGSPNDSGLTPRQKAAKAALADYEYLRAWCNDDWAYSVVTVEDTSTGFYDCLGGVEYWSCYSDSDPKNAYVFSEVVPELARSILAHDRLAA